ncbi:MAG TPA: hypothetical protein VGS19_12340 [Streptosporangiaceae bacterium]|nr:hypothetical protein [Streptosporangiaceae bacterium]
MGRRRDRAGGRLGRRGPGRRVGWNTRRDGEAWIPTFPNARYVLPGPDVSYRDPVRGQSPRLADANRNVCPRSAMSD